MGETKETVRDFIWGDSEITADGDCNHEIKRHLLLGRKAMTNLDSILKSRHISSLLKLPPISQSLLKLMSTESVMSFNNLVLCCPLLLLPSIFTNIRVFSSESAVCIRWQKYWSFSFSISPSNGYSGLIIFTIDWFDLLAVQGTLKSLSSPAPQFESISSSALNILYSQTVTSIHDYWKNRNIECTDLFGKVMSLLFNTLGLSKLFFQGASVF